MRNLRRGHPKPSKLRNILHAFTLLILSRAFYDFAKMTTKPLHFGNCASCVSKRDFTVKIIVKLFTGDISSSSNIVAFVVKSNGTWNVKF